MEQQTATEEAEQGRTGPNRSKNGPAIAGWRIVRALTSGKSSLIAAAEFRMQTRAVSDRAEQYHLAYGSVFLCDQGQPFRHAALDAIRKAAGFSQAAFERVVGLRHLAATEGRNGPTAIHTPEIARPVIAWRDQVIRAMTQAAGDRQRHYHNTEVIHTLLPDLDSLFDALAETFGQSAGRYAKPAGLQAELIAHPDWTIDDVWHFAAENGRREGEGSPWHRTMCFLWEIKSTLDLAKLRQTESIASFVFETLGARYGVHPETIKRALQKGANPTRTIEPEKMLGLVLSALAAVPASKKYRRPREPMAETRAGIKFAGALVRVHKEQEKDVVWTDHAARICPDNPANIHKFTSRHRARIAFAAETMTLAEAEVILST